MRGRSLRGIRMLVSLHVFLSLALHSKPFSVGKEAADSVSSQPRSEQQLEAGKKPEETRSQPLTN